MRGVVRGGLAALALTAPVAVMCAAGSAASSCRGMTVGYSVSNGQLVVLSPDHVAVAFGGCVSFTNRTASTATVTVGGRYSQQVPPNASTSGSRNFIGTTSGHLTVTATSGPGTAHGSVTVGARAGSTASPTPSRTTTPAPAPTPTPVSSSSRNGGPQVAPSPKHRRHSRQPTPGPGGIIEPPVSPPGPIQLTPSTSPSPASTGVVAGPIEPASGRGVGLPAAVAAFLVVGTGAAIVRVVAAEPVDSA